MPPELEPNTIWKYELEMVDEQTIRTPIVWNPIHVDMQDGILCLWAEVDARSTTTERTIGVYGTGHSLRDKHWQWQHLDPTQRHVWVWTLFGQPEQHMGYNTAAAKIVWRVRWYPLATHVGLVVTIGGLLALILRTRAARGAA